MKELDSTDLKIIELLAHNSRIKLKILAEQVSLSEPSVKTRIERLADQGIIRSFTIDIDYAKLGYNLSFLIKVSNLKVSIQAFTTKIKNIKEIQSFYPVTGEENYILHGRVQSIEQLEKILEQLMNYGKITTSIALDEPHEKQLIDSLDSNDVIQSLSIL